MPIRIRYRMVIKKTEVQLRECFLDITVTVAGTWSAWGDYNNCSVSCGGGVMRRSRLCVPSDSCTGEAHSSLPCNYNGCPVDGEWSTWTSWTVCSVSCSGGAQTRRRECVGPYDGGSPCGGLADESQNCEEQLCPSKLRRIY